MPLEQRVAVLESKLESLEHVVKQEQATLRDVEQRLRALESPE